MNTALFQSVSLFSGISPDSLHALSQLTKQQVFKKGEVILDFPHSSKTFLYVLKGWIKLFKESAEGEEIIVDVLTNTQHCGETFAFNENPTDYYEAQSLSETEVLTLPIEGLKKLMFTDHALSINFLQAALQKQHTLNMNMEHMAIQNAAQRIGCYILRLRRTQASQLPYDKTLLALRLGMRPETFSRALHKLHEECEVQLEGDAIHILNMSKLINYVCKHCSKIYPCNEAA